MRKHDFLLIAALAIVVVGCGRTASKEGSGVNEATQDTSILAEQAGGVAEEATDEKYLITNNSVGYFRFGGAWQEYAKKEYNYSFVESYGSCVDACCDGGFDLGSASAIDEYGRIETPEITIATVLYEESESFDDRIERRKHKNNKEVFYVSSENCKGWYWRDKANYFVVYSQMFKTKEGIGVGTTLDEIEAKIGKLQFHVGWIEEDMNALQVVIKSYPNVSFILDVDDYKGDWEELSLMNGYENTLKTSDFKKDTKIRRLVVRQAETN